MPRNMSFAITKSQVRDQTKDVTRRFGWWFLKPGDVVQPVEKSQGLKAGEKVQYIGGLIRIVSTRAEPLNAITKEDCIREGFPDYEICDFIGMLQGHYYCRADKTVNRIEFEYL